MSDERRQRISEKAYRLWEKEGQPTGRDLDHWIEAERDVDGSQPNEGDGNRTAARAHNRKAKSSAETGPVERRARKAKADLDGPKGKKPREAELLGKSHSHGDAPAAKPRRRPRVA